MASSTNGIKNAGLMSGLDTENLVKQMASLTKSKINRQKQKLQSLQWKQEGYRNIIKKISRRYSGNIYIFNINMWTIGVFYKLFYGKDFPCKMVGL